MTAVEGAPAGPGLRHGHAISAVSFSRDGALLASGTVDGWVRVFDASDGALVGKRRLPGCEVTAVEFGDGFLAVGTNNGEVSGWLYGGDADVALLAKHRGPVAGMRLTQAGRGVSWTRARDDVALWVA